MSWWSELDPDIQSDARALVALVQSMGGVASVTSVRRSPRSEAQILRLAGVQGTAVTAHVDGRAFDVVITPHALARIAGLTWRRMGGRWNEADPIHFEL